MYGLFNQYSMNQFNPMGYGGGMGSMMPQFGGGMMPASMMRQLAMQQMSAPYGGGGASLQSESVQQPMRQEYARNQRSAQFMNSPNSGFGPGSVEDPNRAGDRNRARSLMQGLGVTPGQQSAGAPNSWQQGGGQNQPTAWQQNTQISGAPGGMPVTNSQGGGQSFGGGMLNMPQSRGNMPQSPRSMFSPSLGRQIGVPSRQMPQQQPTFPNYRNLPPQVSQPMQQPQQQQPSMGMQQGQQMPATGAPFDPFGYTQSQNWMQPGGGWQNPLSPGVMGHGMFFNNQSGPQQFQGSYSGYQQQSPFSLQNFSQYGNPFYTDPMMGRQYGAGLVDQARDQYGDWLSSLQYGSPVGGTQGIFTDPSPNQWQGEDPTPAVEAPQESDRPPPPVRPSAPGGLGSPNAEANYNTDMRKYNTDMALYARQYPEFNEQRSMLGLGPWAYEMWRNGIGGGV